jgi:hypothetical protein
MEPLQAFAFNSRRVLAASSRLYFDASGSNSCLLEVIQP